MLYLLDVHEIHAVQCAALELSWGREISKLTFNSFSFYGMEIHLDGHDVCTYNEGTWIKLLFRSSRVEMSVTIMAWRVKWKAKLSFKNLEIWDVLVFGHIGCIQWCKRKFVRIIPGSDFLPAIWRIETNFVKSQEDKWGGWKAKRWIYDKKAPDMLPWIQLDLIKNTKHSRYHNTKHPMISTTTFDPKTPREHKRINHFLCTLRSITKSLAQFLFTRCPKHAETLEDFKNCPLATI